MDELLICDEVLISIKQITRAIDIQSKRLVQKSGLTGPQLLVLKENLKLGQIPTGTLSKEVNLSQATVTSILDRLEKKGLVKRNRGEVDKRKVFTEITESGKDAVMKAPSLLQDEFRSEFFKLEDWEQTLVLSSLKRVAAMMNAKNIETSPVLMASYESEQI